MSIPTDSDVFVVGQGYGVVVARYRNLVTTYSLDGRTLVEKKQVNYIIELRESGRTIDVPAHDGYERIVWAL